MEPTRSAEYLAKTGNDIDMATEMYFDDNMKGNPETPRFLFSLAPHGRPSFLFLRLVYAY